MRAVGIIPSRFNSTRFPGKPLADILGKPMVVRVYERARLSRLDDVLVATDDERILAACNRFEIPAVMTRANHESGTDRVAEAVLRIEADHVVNIQGDEPLIDPALIDSLLDALSRHTDADVVTACSPLSDPKDLQNPNVVKLEFSPSGRVLDFFRRPHIESNTSVIACMKHIGIYGFSRKSLLHLSQLPRTVRETEESLEQLRALEQGMRFIAVQTAWKTLAVDTPDDLEHVRLLLSGLEDAIP